MEKNEQKAGTSATVAIIAAAGSYLVSFMGHPIFGLLIALVSVPLGVVGLVMAASPRVGGGLLSLFSIILGIGAIGISILVMIGVIIF